MKNISGLFLLLLILSFAVSSGSALAATTDEMVRVGLFYGDGALSTANLENSSGSGYRFGYYDSADCFINLGSTQETQISMLKAQNIYLKDDLYYPTDPGNSTAVIGCYHLQLPETYASFQEAQVAAARISNAFPAWISGQYVVRIGSYPTKDAAQSAGANLGIASTSIVGTSAYGLSVTRSKTPNILFQFDSGGAQTFVVNPDLSDSIKSITWFKGYRYYGDFIYERINGGNLTVSNYLSMDDYVKGILPYEMSASWPLDALKAQAVCARTYTLSATGNRHSSQHFDICNTTCCQVYRGTNSSSANTDRAVEETSGLYAYYNGALAQTFYYASNGGASEDVKNVWGSTSNLPYLCGVKDPYEQTIESTIPGYHWSASFTSEKLTSMLQAKGYSCSTIVDLKVTQFTPLGNVFSIAFVDSTGNTFPFTKERARTILGLKSMRFQISGGGSSVGDTYYVDEGGSTLSGLSGLWSISADGASSKLPDSGLYAITASGSTPLVAGSSGGGTTSGLFTVTGSGNGHHVGMSQWGAYAMAKQSFTYDEILKFYFVGIDLN